MSQLMEVLLKLQLTCILQNLPKYVNRKPLGLIVPPFIISHLTV